MLFRQRINKWKFTAALALVLGLSTFDGMGSPIMKPPSTLPPLIPAPKSWRPAEGTFSLADLRRVVVQDGGREMLALAKRAAARLEPVLDHTLPVQVAGAGSEPAESLFLRRRTGLAPEQYEMRITGEAIEISATHPAGFHHGISTLVQLALNGHVSGKSAVLPAGVIQDQPRFGWRGMLLDCGRHFMSVEFIKELLDKLALHKFNVLHWHLTEDQGWRLEIPGYPRLTEIGAWRTEIDGSIHGGFYTAADVREIVDYAAERFITVVPEIEMPGHSLAALAAYPELSCTGGPFAVETQWGIHRDVFCPGRDETFAFLEDVLTHVMEIFPGDYIHIGGDEVPKDRWRKCEHCQTRIRDEGLAGEDELQSWFIARIGNFLAAHGRRLIGWDEILTGGLPGDPEIYTVQAWRGLDEAEAAARTGYDVIVSPTSHAYFDYDPGVLGLQQVFDFRPVPPGLDVASTAHILGGQMNLWTEYIPQPRVDTMLFPRLTAMAEALWTGSEKRDFAAFLDRLHGHEPVLDHLGVQSGVAARPVIITGHHDPARTGHPMEITLDPRVADALAGQDLAVRYLILESPLPPSFHPGFLPENEGLPSVTPADDTVPEFLEIPSADRTESSWLVQARLFVDDRPYGAPALLEVSGHVAAGADIDFLHEPNERYPGGGTGGIVNGFHGSWYFQDELWTGFEGEDFDATVDLGRPRQLESVSVRFLQDVNSWILLPREVRFTVSSDGVVWLDAGVVSHEVPDKTQDKLIHEFAVNLDGSPVRFVGVHGVSPGVCPGWHPGRGKPCWLFVDEIVCR
jgi:hexosaminidase